MTGGRLILSSGAVSGAVLLALLFAPGAAAADRIVATEQRTVVAYSFHGTLRCTTCVLVERGAEEAIRGDFPGELAAGSLSWRSINIRLPGNEHYAAEYQVGSWALVLAEHRGEAPGRWMNLSRAGELVHADPGEFRRYVTAEVRAFLDAAPVRTGEGK